MTLEFGHIAKGGPGFRLDGWGVGPFLLTVAGKTFRFEDSDRFGPVLINKDGSVSERQPGERSPFWRAHRAWRVQGRRLDTDSETCVFDPLKPTRFRQDDKGQCHVVEYGDPDGGYEEVAE